MCKISLIDKISFVLCLVSCFNWGFIGMFNLNFAFILTGGSIILQRLIYTLFFLAALNILGLYFRSRYVFNNN
jgi:uncharacterized membrane protein YuzA (DUF378 family)